MVTSGGTLLERPSAVPELTLPAPEAALPPKPHLLRWLLALMLFAAALVGAILGAIALAPEEVAGPSDGPMGLTQQAWVEYRTGERATSAAGTQAAEWRTWRAGERATVLVDARGAGWVEYRAGER